MNVASTIVVLIICPQHEAPVHRPAHAVNVLVALGDVPLEMGPTEVAPGTHRLTNHLHPERNGWLSRDDMLYQSELEYTPEQLRAGIALPSGAVPDSPAAAVTSCEEREGLTALSAGPKHLADRSSYRIEHFCVHASVDVLI
eukprot:COSAG02_NODE_8902_length_2405_cov_1.394189_4_plen_142_part_00